MLTKTQILHFFFFNDTATTEIYTLSLHDALPIFIRLLRRQLHWAVVVDQKNAVLLQSEVEGHRVRLAVRDHLRVKDDADVGKRDLADLIDRFIGDPHITLDRSHPLLGPVERDDRALTAGSDDRGAEDVRAGHNPLAADARHTNVKALCHLSSSLISPPARDRKSVV